eukprot:SAG11_NODE_9668_length_890_cov_11.345133_1_plen_50_part_10
MNLALAERIAATCATGTRVVSYKPLAPMSRTRGGQRRAAAAGAAGVKAEG